MSWSPEQYLKFAQPRLRPAIDLLDHIVLEQPKEICDLGCGAGNVTAILAARWPGARILGVDTSAAMLARAAQVLPQATWQQQSLAEWRAPSPLDLIYSNAALHWLPDHARLLRAILTSLRPGGVLAVQMPRNFAAPSHTLITEVAREAPWRDRLEPLLRTPPVATQAPAFYYDVLAPLADSIDIWESEYLQVFNGPDPVKEWTKGTALIPYLQRLDAEAASSFELEYARRLRDAYPARADGVTLFPFRRLFIVMRKAG
jgi:trans-aconitate 2-methyltransferase